MYITFWVPVGSIQFYTGMHFEHVFLARALKLAGSEELKKLVMQCSNSCFYCNLIDLPVWIALHNFSFYSLLFYWKLWWTVFHVLVHFSISSPIWYQHPLSTPECSFIHYHSCSVWWAGTSRKEILTTLWSTDVKRRKRESLGDMISELYIWNHFWE